MSVLSLSVIFLLLILFKTADARAALGVPSSCQDDLDWAFNTGKNTFPEWYPEMEETCGISITDATFEDLQRYFKCKNINSNECNEKGLMFPLTCSTPPCDQCTVTPPIPDSCIGHLDWAFNTGKNDFPEYYSDMETTCGVSVQDANLEDFQRLFKCKNINAGDCNDQGLQFPTTCTNPPCDVCTVEQCCAGENVDVYNPNVCPTEDHPVDCCAGLEKTFIHGPNNFICKETTPTVAPTTESPSTDTPSTDDPFGSISIEGRNILVNGKVFYMKGVNWNPVPKGRSHPPREEDFINYAKLDAPKMIEAGINIVRSYATITSTEVLDILVDNGIRVVNPINPLSSKIAFRALFVL